MKISFGGGHDHASLVSSPTLNATGDAPCPSFRSGDEGSFMPEAALIDCRKTASVYMMTNKTTANEKLD